jgi:hypothetical protein
MSGGRNCQTDQVLGWVVRKEATFRNIIFISLIISIFLICSPQSLLIRYNQTLWFPDNHQKLKLP